jgi:hypothetical protein
MNGRVTGTGRRLRWASPTTATVVGVVALLAPFATIPLAILIDRTTSSGPSAVGLFLLFGLAFAAVGVVVARREPRNPIGWLLLGASLAMTLGTVGPEYAYLDYTVHHGRLPLGPVGVLLSQAWVYSFMLLPLIVLFFPDGRLGSRWRWPLRAYFCAIVVYVAGTLNVAVVALSLRMPVDSGGASSARAIRVGAPPGLARSRVPSPLSSPCSVSRRWSTGCSASAIRAASAASS